MPTRIVINVFLEYHAAMIATRPANRRVFPRDISIVPLGINNAGKMKADKTAGGT